MSTRTKIFTLLFVSAAAFFRPLSAQDVAVDVQADSPKETFSKVPKVQGVVNLRYRYEDQQYKYEREDGSYKDTSVVDLNSFDVRRARIDVRGYMAKDLEYRVFAEFGGGVPKLLNAHLRWQINENMTLLAGQYKIPFTLEGPYQFSELEVIDFSLPVTSQSNYNDTIAGIVANGRDVGISLIGKLLHRDGYSIINYDFGVFNGAGINVSDNNTAKDITGLLVIKPTRYVSLAASHYHGTTGYQSGTRAVRSDDRKRIRSSVGARYDDKKLLLRSEYIWGQTGSRHSDGAYAVAGYFVHPKIQPVAKYEYFRPDAKDNTSRQDNVLLGINYVPMKNMCYQLNYTRKFFHEKEGNYVAAQMWLRF